MAEYETTLFSNLQENLSKIELENITSVTLNTDVLKTNFEAIVTILKGLSKKCDTAQSGSSDALKENKDLRERLEKLEDKQRHDKDELNDKIFGNGQKIKEVEKDTDKNTKDIEKLQESLKELMDSQKDFKDFTQSTQDELNAIKEKLEKHDKQIQDLLNRIASGNNESKDHDAVPVEVPVLNTAEIDNLRQDMNDMKKSFEDQIAELHKLLEDFVKKDEFNSYKDQTDNKLQGHQESIDDLYEQLKGLRSLINDKLDCENFDEHLNDYNQIKNLVYSLVNNQNNQASEGEEKPVIQQIQQIVQAPAMSTKDSNLLKELGQKFPELEALIKKVQKDLNDHMLNYKTFSDDTTKKIQSNEENLKNYKTETNKKIADLEALFKSLRDQIANLNVSVTASKNTTTQVVRQNSGQGSSVDHSGDIRNINATLQTLIERINNLEKELLEIQNLKEKVNNLQDIAAENRQKISNLEEELFDVKSLKARVEMLEQLLREKESKDHKAKASRGASFENSPQHATHNGCTIEQVRQIVDEEIRKLRDEILAMLDELRAALDKKADLEDLYKSESGLLEKLDQIAGALMKRAQADKNDTKKALMFLEKKIKEITVIIMGGPSNSEDGAIFAKKPWQPWSCASCDSKLKDYPGALIDHKHWNKLPQRETSPGRLTQGKFGKGWSKYVETKKTVVEKSRDPFSATATKFGESLPDIHREKVANPDSFRNE